MSILMAFDDNNLKSFIKKSSVLITNPFTYPTNDEHHEKILKE